jgi:hypothetical protein
MTSQVRFIAYIWSVWLDRCVTLFCVLSWSSFAHQSGRRVPCITVASRRSNMEDAIQVDPGPWRLCHVSYERWYGLRPRPQARVACTHPVLHREQLWKHLSWPIVLATFNCGARGEVSPGDGLLPGPLCIIMWSVELAALAAASCMLWSFTLHTHSSELVHIVRAGGRRFGACGSPNTFVYHSKYVDIPPCDTM